MILGLVWFVYLCFGMSVGSLAPLVDTIREDLDISSTGMGMILGTWQLVYVLCAYAMGTMVDRLGVRRSIGLGIGLVSLSLVLRAVAVDFYSLMFIVAIHGIGGPIISVGAPKAVAVWFVGRKRGLGTGVYNTGPMLGSILVLALTNSAVVPLTGHWRYSFVVYGGVALAATIVWWLLAKDPSDDNGGAGSTSEMISTTTSVSAMETLKALLKLGNVRVVLILAFASFFLEHGLAQWLPTVFIDQGRSDSIAGILAAIPLTTGILGLLFIPYIVPHRSRAWTLTILLLIGALGNIGVIHLAGPALITILALSGPARLSVLSLLTLVLMETRSVGRQYMGAASGMLFTVAEIGGFTGPLFLGLLRDVTDTLTSGLVLLTVVAGTLSLSGLFITEEHQER